MNQRIGIFNIGDVNAQLDNLRREAFELTQLMDGARRDADSRQQNTSQRFAQLYGQLSELFNGVNDMVVAINDIMSRLRFYEENVTFLKIANKSYNAKVRDDAERASIAKKAAEARTARTAPTPPEATPPQATGPQLVPDDMNPVLAAELSEGDAIMGTDELQVGHFHD